jgi:hypothetical protein
MIYNIANSGRRGHDHTVLGFTTTSAYHHKSCEFQLCSQRNTLDTT